MAKIKKGDNVQIMRGKDSGKNGEVLTVVKKISKYGTERIMVVVKGINVVKKSQKPNPQFGIKGGFVEFEKPIDISNVMLLSASGKPSRVGYEIKDGKKSRVFKKDNKKK